MLTDRDPAVLARINAVAVLGALAVLPDVSENARATLAGVDRPTTVTLRVPGLPARSLTFTAEGVASGAGGDRTVTLGFLSPEHLNRMIDGGAQPIPIAGPGGLRFLTRVFAPLADELGRLLRPEPSALADPAIRAVNALLTLHVAIAAVAQVANADRAGRFSAGLIPDGEIRIDVGEELSLRLVARDHALTFAGRAPEGDVSSPARATLSFASLDVAGDVLAGRASALSCIGDGSMGMRGYIPMIDNVSRILDRVGHYLGD